MTTFALCEMPRWFALGNRGTLRLDDMTGENGSIVRLKTEVDVEELSKRGSVAPSLTLAPLDNLYKEKFLCQMKAIRLCVSGIVLLLH